jgi:hypothetical protein
MRIRWLGRGQSTASTSIAAAGTASHAQFVRRRGTETRSNTRCLSPTGGSTSSIRLATRSIARSNSCSSLLFTSVTRSHQLLLQHSPCLGDAPFDRAERHAKHRGDLFVRVVSGGRQHQWIPQLLRQGGDQPSELLALRRRQQRVFLRRAGGWEVLDTVQRLREVGCLPRRGQPRYPPADALSPIDGFSPCDRQEPGPERRLAPKRLELPERRQERLLRDIVGFRGRTDRGQGGPKHSPTVPVYQLAERVPVASLRPAHQREVRRIGGLGRAHTVYRGQGWHGGWEK